MVNSMNCYYCDFYNEDTDKCELGYFNENDCEQWEDESEE